MEGKRIVLCASRKLEEMSTLIKKQGGIPLLRPAQGTVFAREEELKDDLRTLIETEADWFVFTTGIGAEAIFSAAEKFGLKEELVGRIQGAHVAIRGYKTLAALKKIGITPHVYSDDGTTKGLINALKEFEFNGKSVVIQLYGDTAPALKQFFAQRGAKYSELLPYRHVAPDREILEQLYNEITSGEVDAVCFTAAMQVRFLFEFAKEYKDVASLQRAFGHHVVAVAVGKVTAESLYEEGVERVIAPQLERMGAMIIELSNFFKKELKEGYNV
ncbi:uroporphyrinogen-III synthase [Anoxybacillus vitaminiphilus]|uniref:Uroporphyrinogen-III synthase n=1 Tax=Paranoxybacillus vitaminiphilus TaxID=581036 RepID=A0A327YFP8_9BACL|nr:uroporphyrinogen-III synthase [Anoxybacillus vitaminiphilus]RAK18926.1 uroporphyrinogen-III synthase [Anoxybacillus vitaminiphilus]